MRHPVGSVKMNSPPLRFILLSAWPLQTRDIFSPFVDIITSPGDNSCTEVASVWALVIVIRHCLLNFSSPVTIPLAHCILLLSYTGPVLQIVGLTPIHDVGSKIPPVSVWKATYSGTCNCVLNSDELPGIAQLCNLYRRYVNLSIKGKFARKTNILSFCHNGSIRTCE